MLQRFQRIRETDMKKLLLITGVFLSTSLWADDMDYQCSIATPDKYISQITHGQGFCPLMVLNN